MIATNNERSKNRSILITGVAGFIGSHLAQSLLRDRVYVIGVDSLSSYYSVDIKQRRLSSLREYQSFDFYHSNIADAQSLSEIFEAHAPQLVVHLAAQAGVVAEESLIPSYIESNVYGADVIMQLCARLEIPLIYASSSSVYGDCSNVPFLESEKNLLPKSLYAQTKLHNEHLASLYAKYLGLKSVGLRFFSIYGEDMRPDMAISLFTDAIYHNKPITLYGDHTTARDFTYINDLVCVMKLLAHRLCDNEVIAPIYNIGSQSPVPIERVVEILWKLLNRSTPISRMPLRSGEANITYSDTSLLYHHFGTRPATAIEEGLKRYVEWYLTMQSMI